MGKIVTNFSMSLDGYIAGPNEDFAQLFKWYGSGDTEMAFDSGMVMKISATSADLLRESFSTAGVFLMGRRLFDITNGWSGKPPVNVPVIVITHHPPETWQSEGTVPYYFVDSIDAALAQARAVVGDKDIVISSATIAQQIWERGLLDEVHLDLVPFVLGDGVRLFEKLGAYPAELEVIRVVPTPDVTHLAYRVVK